MPRFLLMPLVAMLLSTPLGAAAETPAESERAAAVNVSAPALPSWAEDRGGPSATLKVLYGSYGVLQGLDIYSTAVARRAGASEANPLMDGNAGQALAFKAVMGGVTYFAASRLARKNHKAAMATMFILNGVTAAVVANNMKNSRR